MIEKAMKKNTNMKTQEELLEELLEEARQARRYAEELRNSSTRIIELISTVFEDVEEAGESTDPSYNTKEE